MKIPNRAGQLWKNQWSEILLVIDSLDERIYCKHKIIVLSSEELTKITLVEWDDRLWDDIGTLKEIT